MVWFALLILTGLAGCRRADETYKARGPEYFPLRVGAERNYIYDSIRYSRIGGSVRTFNFRVREIVKDSFLDQEGRITYRIEQYISRDTGRTYTFSALHSVNTDAYGVQRVVENRRNLVLSYPIRNQRSWYPYFYWNDSFLTSTRYQYTAVGKKYFNDWYDFNDAVFVKQQYDSTFIFVKESREIYARDFGLVYRLKKDIDLQVLDEPDGYVVTWRLNKYYP